MYVPITSQHNWGLTLLKMERYEDAGLIFESIINDEPNAEESWAALGLCMANLKQEEAALACQRQVVKIRAMKENFSVE